jgi:hypothetical protein
MSDALVGYPKMAIATGRSRSELDVTTTVFNNNRIELRVDNVAPLFHTSFRFHFGKKILIERRRNILWIGLANWPPISRSGSRFSFQRPRSRQKAAQEITEAFRRYFSERAGVIQRDLKELFGVGRRSPGIGVSILVACLMSAHFAGG